METTKNFVIDGRKITSLESFYEFVGSEFFDGKIPENLDAFGEMLGNLVEEEGAITVRWADASLSRDVLGYPETLRALVEQLKHAHPDNIETIKEKISSAEAGQGETLFDTLEEIFLNTEQVTLILE